MRILITGAAGFIGFSLIQYLKNLNLKNLNIYGLDNFDNYYSVKLKKNRIKNINKKKFKFFKIDITNEKKLFKLISNIKPNLIIHLAAQAGVRYSVKNPKKYIDVNILGFHNLISCCKQIKVNKIIYASSSSVYGEINKFPLNENLNLKPKNLYGLSKKFNEELAEVYSNFYKMKFTGLRLFTVYGEWGRPDMFFYKYLTSSKANKTFYLNNFGNHFRDFTYIQDVVKIIYKLIVKKQKKNHEIFNICSGKYFHLKKIIVELNKFIKAPKIVKRKLQKADIKKTHGNNNKIKKNLLIKNFTDISKGIEKTCLWYLNNYKLFN